MTTKKDKISEIKPLLDVAIGHLRGQAQYDYLLDVMNKIREESKQSQCQKCSISEHPENPRFSEKQKIIEEIKKLIKELTFDIEIFEHKEDKEITARINDITINGKSTCSIYDASKWKLLRNIENPEGLKKLKQELLNSLGEKEQ